MTKTVAKQISLSDQLLVFAGQRLKELGIGFSEYIKFLILQDTKKIRDGVPFITDVQSKVIRDAKKDVENGNYVSLNSDEEIDKNT